MRGIVLLILAFGAVLLASVAHAEPVTGSTITISLSEYEKLKEYEEGDKKKQFWKMTFEQILEKEGDPARAWKKYDYWVLRNIYLNTGVSGGKVDDLTGEIAVLNQIGDAPITLHITSPGGEVYAGLVLYNAMLTSKAPVNTVCDSMAASMAAVLFAAGRERVAMPDCHFMIHEVGVGGAPGGQTVDFVKWADRIIDVENMMVAILSENSGLSEKEVRTLMEYETFYDSDEILRLGFADSVLTAGVIREGRNIPDDLLPKNRMKRNLLERVAVD